MAAGTEAGAPPDNQIATLYLGGGGGRWNGGGGRWEGWGEMGEVGKRRRQGTQDTGDREHGETVR